MVLVVVVVVIVVIVFIRVFLLICAAEGELLDVGAIISSTVLAMLSTEE